MEGPTILPVQYAIVKSEWLALFLVNPAVLEVMNDKEIEIPGTKAK